MLTTPKQQRDKAQTIQKKQNQQQHITTTSLARRSQQSKITRNFPCFFFKKSGNQSKSIKMLQLPVLEINLVLEET